MSKTNTATKHQRSVRDEQVARRESALHTVHEIARREGLGNSQDSDANSLGGALAQAGLDAAEYVDMVTLVQRHAKLAAAVDDAKAIVALGRARRELKDHDAQVRKLRDAKPALVADLNRAQRDLGTIHGRRDALAELEYCHALLLGLDPPPDDLDGFTLKSNDTMLNVYDHEAPTLTVPSKVFDEQSKRRHGMLKVARAQALEANIQAVQSWLAKGKPNALGVQIGKGTPPTKNVPTWRSIAAMPRAERDELAEAVRSPATFSGLSRAWTNQ